MNLYHLIYSSYAKPNLGYHDFRDIMQRSESNNQNDGITGMLCYGDSVFLQILEGDRALISKTFNRISSDPRHHTTELIECVPIESRSFALWTMKMVNFTQLKSPKVKSLILKYSGSTFLKPQTMNPQQCLNLMKEIRAFFEEEE